MFIQSCIFSSESHNTRTSGSFKVILIGVGGNPGRGVFVRYTNVDLISENYEDISTGKLQIRRFQSSHFCLTTVVREKPSDNLYCRKLCHWPTFMSRIVWVYVDYFSRNNLWKSNPLSLKCWHENQVWHETATQGHCNQLLQAGNKLLIVI